MPKPRDPLAMDKKVVYRFFVLEPTKLKFLLLRIASVGTFPLVAVQAKKQALVGALDLHIVTAGKARLVDPSLFTNS